MSRCGSASAFPGAGPDALFPRLFVLTVSELPPRGARRHVAGNGARRRRSPGLIYRIRMAQRFASAQRAADLERFTALRDG
jgi:hypothetical protein